MSRQRLPKLRSTRKHKQKLYRRLTQAHNRVLKSYLTIPSTTPIEIAHGLDGMNGVIYVGTDEEGRQYLAMFDTVERICEKVYTAEAGMKIVSVTENVKRKSYKDRAAYCWVETDGDYWRILFNDDSPGPDYSDLSEFTYAEGRLSEGSAFIPKYSEDVRVKEWKLALVSPADAAEMPYLFRRNEMPIPIDSPIASANGFPIFAIGAGQFIHTGQIEGQEHFIFHDLYGTSCSSSPYDWFSYQLPAGENLVRIVEGTNNFMGSIDLCLLTDAGNCYGYVHEDATPYLVLRNVTQAMGSRINCTFLLTGDGTKLYTWDGVVGDVPLYYNENATLTGLAEGYVTKETNAPYEVFVFSDESDGQYMKATIKITSMMTTDTHPPATISFTSAVTPAATAFAASFSIFHAVFTALTVSRPALCRLCLATCADCAVLCAARPAFFVFFTGFTDSVFRACETAAGGISSRCCFCRRTLFATYRTACPVRCSAARTVRCSFSSTHPSAYCTGDCSSASRTFCSSSTTCLTFPSISAFGHPQDY